mmetsp:Transcript_49001/g.97400  ORF Transcript_49001/g.97400 Transcript_49001/m.97400 type:complete len:113 (-) Transcript_49001:444-782(-)
MVLSGGLMALLCLERCGRDCGLQFVYQSTTTSSPYPCCCQAVLASLLASRIWSRIGAVLVAGHCCCGGDRIRGKTVVPEMREKKKENNERKKIHCMSLSWEKGLNTAAYDTL